MENETIPQKHLRIDKEREQEHRILLVMTAVFLLVAVSVYGLMFGRAWRAYWKYQPQEGDIVFQSLPVTPLVRAIEGATQSPYSHCAIVAKQGGQWIVYEAYNSVEVTPLRTFLFRGRNQGFAVYRLRSPYRSLIPEILKQTKEFLGHPYDSRYRLDDENIYCSELIYKAFERASHGQQLGSLVQLGELNWQPYQKTIQHYENGPVPLDREMITPEELAAATQLELLITHELSTDAK